MKLLLPLFALLLASACVQDELPEPEVTDCIADDVPSYQTDVLPIIERTCAYSGCHLGGAPGVYNDYEGLLADLESRNFHDRVINQRADPTIGMPPNYSPEGRPQDLTDDELRIINCWLEAGYPNN